MPRALSAMMAVMSEEIHGAVRRLNQTLAAMLVAAVDAETTDPKADAVVEQRRLAREALLVDGLSAEDALHASSRLGAVMIIELCRRIGIDPGGTVREFEENYFRMDL